MIAATLAGRRLAFQFRSGKSECNFSFQTVLWQLWVGGQPPFVRLFPQISPISFSLLASLPTADCFVLVGFGFAAPLLFSVARLLLFLAGWVYFSFFLLGAGHTHLYGQTPTAHQPPTIRMQCIAYLQARNVIKLPKTNRQAGPFFAHPLGKCRKMVGSMVPFILGAKLIKTIKFGIVLRPGNARIFGHGFWRGFGFPIFPFFSFFFFFGLLVFAQ